MRNAKLTILASLSLVTLAALAWGYVGGLGLSIEYASATPSSTMDSGVLADVWAGQFTVAYGYSTVPPRNGLSPGLHVVPLHRLKTPLARDWPWRFYIVRMYTGWGGSRDGVRCPLWFAALPFTIAPIAWLRRRRRRETRGFAVEGSQPSQPASEQPNQPPELPSHPRLSNK